MGSKREVACTKSERSIRTFEYADCGYRSVAFFESNGLAESSSSSSELGIVECGRIQHRRECFGDDVEFFLRRFTCAAPGILEQYDQQQCENTRYGMDRNLPGLEIRPPRQADKPGHDNDDTEKEERCLTDSQLCMLDESVKPRPTVASAAGLSSVAASLHYRNFSRTVCLRALNWMGRFQVKCADASVDRRRFVARAWLQCEYVNPIQVHQGGLIRTHPDAVAGFSAEGDPLVQMTTGLHTGRGRIADQPRAR